MILEGFDHVAFQRDFWQQKPLLIRHTGKPFRDPLEADELAGLSCEAEVESRLVVSDGGRRWQLRQGPFDPVVFSSLGEKNWTLLVQAVDQLEPEVEALKKPFSFLPSWRIDDVMVSYACDGGGVGPHFDHYDVFLIQGQGRRRWQIGQLCDSTSTLRQDTELRILASFQPTAEHVLEPGDILYLPPRIAHQGISLGESLCYSVGFRAPSLAELIQGFTDRLADRLNEDRRYTDPPNQQLPGPGAIGSEAISTTFNEIVGLTNNNALFSEVFGELVTQPRYPERILSADPEYTAQDLINIIRKERYPIVFNKNPSSRFAYFEDPGSLMLCVDGRSFPCQIQLLPLIHLY